MQTRFGKIIIFTCALFALAGCKKANGANQSTREHNKTEEVTFYIVRHGKTMLNTTDRVQGWSDAVLTPAGEKVVTAAGIGMKDIDFQNAYSSDSGRAVQTAKMIVGENKKSSKLTVQTDARLREFNFGSYEGDLNHNMWQDIATDQGVTLAEFMKTMTPKTFADSVAKLDKIQVKKGTNWPAEDYDTITKRLTASLDEIAKKEAKKPGSGNILLASHGLSISALMATLSTDFKMPEGGIKNASVCIVKYKKGKYTIKKINDLTYVKKGQAKEQKVS